MTSTAIHMFSIDTLAFSRRLEKAGMKKETAEALAEEVKEIQIQSSEALATKVDISRLEGEIALLRKEIKQSKNETRQEIKIAMLTTITSLGAIMAFIEKFLN